ncbi:MAG TPA: fumarylacetoacetate hydrolase family protein [Micropepsaceae bacterium]|nr:fumarylacetoacetate hydrolase family protein [Micropepsaceae bacterium]
MKLVSFRAGGAAHYGVVLANGIVDLSSRLGARYADIKAVLSAGALGEAERVAKGALPDYKLADVTFDPVIPNPGKILCIGLNYEEHRMETGRPKVENPTIFVRFADTQIGHLQPVIKPKLSDLVDYECELAVIIGKPGRYIPEDQAYDYVAGYSCYNDVSIRDYQNHTSQWTPGKNFPATGPFGPYMVTRDEMGNLSGKHIQTRVSGERLQYADFDQMIFPVPRLIEYISRFTRLMPGDVIVSGTPGGVGMRREPRRWMKPGETVEVEIDGIGILKNPIVAED